MIGLTGRAGAGKSFIAGELAGIGKNPEIVSFASGLREEIEEVLGAGRIKALWQKPTSPEIRFILQKYGTDYRRAQDTDYWVKKAMEKAINFNQLARTVIFDDVRFPNEADAIKAEGGFVVRVEASSFLREKRLGKLPEEHASETAMDNYAVDYVIAGAPSNAHDTALRNIMVEATIGDINFLEAIHESLTNRE